MRTTKRVYHSMHVSVQTLPLRFSWIRQCNHLAYQFKGGGSHQTVFVFEEFIWVHHSICINMLLFLRGSNNRLIYIYLYVVILFILQYLWSHPTQCFANLAWLLQRVLMSGYVLYIASWTRAFCLSHVKCITWTTVHSIKHQNLGICPDLDLCWSVVCGLC